MILFFKLYICPVALINIIFNHSNECIARDWLIDVLMLEQFS